MNLPTVAAVAHADPDDYARHKLSHRVYMGMLAFCAASSIPMSYFFFVLPAILRHAGHGAEVIGFVAAAAFLPYALRILWAPLVDHLGKGFASRYRMLALLSLGAGIAAIAGFLPLRPEDDIAPIVGVAMVVFFFLTTAMTALDGYVLATLDVEARKRVTTYQAAGFTLGGIVLGAGAIAIDTVGWETSVILLAAATAVLALPLLYLPKSTVRRARAPAEAGSGSLWRFLRTANARRRAAMSMLAHGGLGLTTGYLPILQVDSGLSPGQAGMFGAIGSNICGLLAATAAGALLVRIGGWHTLAWICAASVVFFAFAAGCHDALAGPAFAIALSFGVMALGYLYVVPYRALVLTACDGPRGATQAAFLTSLDVVVAIISGALAGLVATTIGLTGLFSMSAVLCAAGVAIALWALSRSDETHSSHQEGGIP